MIGSLVDSQETGKPHAEGRHEAFRRFRRSAVYRSAPAKLSCSKRVLRRPAGIDRTSSLLKQQKGPVRLSARDPFERFSTLLTRLQSQQISGMQSYSARYKYSGIRTRFNSASITLMMVIEEGLGNRHKRHETNALALRSGLAVLGMHPLAPEGYRAAPLTAVLIPDTIDEAKIRRSLLMEYGIEIGGGFGHLAGKIWRIGLMGESSQDNNGLYLLHCLESILRREGIEILPGASIAEAHKVLFGN